MSFKSVEDFDWVKRNPLNYQSAKNDDFDKFWTELNAKVKSGKQEAKTSFTELTTSGYFEQSDIFQYFASYLSRDKDVRSKAHYLRNTVTFIAGGITIGACTASTIVYGFSNFVNIPGLILLTGLGAALFKSSKVLSSAELISHYYSKKADVSNSASEIVKLKQAVDNHSYELSSYLTVYGGELYIKKYSIDMVGSKVNSIKIDSNANNSSSSAKETMMLLDRLRHLVHNCDNTTTWAVEFTELFWTIFKPVEEEQYSGKSKSYFNVSNIPHYPTMRESEREAAKHNFIRNVTFSILEEVLIRVPKYRKEALICSQDLDIENKAGRKFVVRKHNHVMDAALWVPKESVKTISDASPIILMSVDKSVQEVVSKRHFPSGSYLIETNTGNIYVVDSDLSAIRISGNADKINSARSIDVKTIVPSEAGRIISRKDLNSLKMSYNPTRDTWRDAMESKVARLENMYKTSSGGMRSLNTLGDYKPADVDDYDLSY